MTAAQVVFERAGQTFAVPAAQIARILPRPTLLRLPNLRGGAQRWALQSGSGLAPFLGTDRPGAALLLSAAEGEIALGVSRVLGVGTLDPQGCWRGQPVQQADAESWTEAAMPPPRAAPFINAPRQQPAAASAPAARSLRVIAGGKPWHIAKADLVAIHPPTPLTPVPLAPAAILGALSLGGTAWPVLALTPAQSAAAALVLLRRGHTAFAIVSEAAPAWAPEAATLDPEATARAAGLVPTPLTEPAPTAEPETISRLLPVTIGRQRFGLLLEHVQRVLAPGRVARLPAPGGPASARPASARPASAGSPAVHGVVGIDGRAVPLTIASVWMGLGPGEAAGTILLLRPGPELHALAVEAAHPPLTLDRARLRPMRDPARRFQAMAETPAGLLAVLDVATLGDPG